MADAAGKPAGSRARAKKRPDLTGSDQLSGDEALLAALLRGLPVAAAAETAGISESTARRRIRDAGFRKRLDEGRAEVIGLVAAQLAGGAQVGYTALVQLAAAASTPPSVRRAAARDLVALAGEIGVARDLEARIEQLEDALGARS